MHIHTAPFSLKQTTQAPIVSINTPLFIIMLHMLCPAADSICTIIFIAVHLCILAHVTLLLEYSICNNSVFIQTRLFCCVFSCYSLSSRLHLLSCRFLVCGSVFVCCGVSVFVLCCTIVLEERSLDMSINLFNLTKVVEFIRNGITE